MANQLRRDGPTAHTIPVIAAFCRERQPVLCSPPPIPFVNQPLELDFHPSEYMVATCLIDGHVHVYCNHTRTTHPHH